MESQADKLFKEELHVVNVGLEVFYESCIEQGVNCTQVDWAPAANGDKAMLDILAALRGR